MLAKLIEQWKDGKDVEAKILEILESEEHQSLPYNERNKHFLTSHKLKTFQECPYFYYLKYIKGISEEVEYEPFIIGQAVDDKITNPDSYTKKYLPVARRTDSIREENPNKTLLTMGQAKTIDAVASEYATRHFFPQKVEKQNVIWLMFGKIPCKAELDKKYDKKTNSFGDIKTCADITTFKYYYYTFQMSFYYEGILETLNEKSSAELYVVDKNAIPRSDKYIFSPESLHDLQGEIHRLAKELQDCEASGIFPFTLDLDDMEDRTTFFKSELYPHLKEFKDTMSPIII